MCGFLFTGWASPPATLPPLMASRARSSSREVASIAGRVRDEKWLCSLAVSVEPSHSLDNNTSCVVMVVANLLILQICVGNSSKLREIDFCSSRELMM